MSFLFEPVEGKTLKKYLEEKKIYEGDNNTYFGILYRPLTNNVFFTTRKELERLTFLSFVLDKIVDNTGSAYDRTSKQLCICYELKD